MSTAGPRFAGIRTFMQLPAGDPSPGLDYAVFGLPLDTASTYRAGARFGPEALRSVSVLLRPFNSATGVDVGVLGGVDAGDVAVVPGNVEETNRRTEAFVSHVLSTGAVPIGLGGDHSVTLGELRALAKVHGPLGLVHFDAHSDLWDEYYGHERYTHGTWVRRALDEKLIDPARGVQIGLRGPLYSGEDQLQSDAVGLAVIRGSRLRQLDPDDAGDLVRSKVQEGPAFLSFDLDFLDPSAAPAVATPEVGGPDTALALDLLRALKGLRFVGFDLVELCPPYDPGQVTAFAGANVVYEFLSLLALAGVEEEA